MSKLIFDNRFVVVAFIVLAVINAFVLKGGYYA